ncbi:MAG: OB-fold domain-containing protein [Erythrobacter sp.]
MSARLPIDPELWSDGPEPHLMGGKMPSGEIVFPMPQGDAARDVEPYKLSRTGRLWSWTSQDFRPKEPYEGPSEGPHDFKSYLVGYVELPGEVIVESLIVGATLEELELGMPMVFTLTPFNNTFDTYAFRPLQAEERQAA